MVFFIAHLKTHPPNVILEKRPQSSSSCRGVAWELCVVLISANVTVVELPAAQGEGLSSRSKWMRPGEERGWETDGIILEDHPMTCKWLGSPPFISHEKAIWNGNNPT